SLRTHLPRRPLFRALLLAGAAVAGSLAVIGTPSDIPAEASADDPWTLPVPPERCTEEQVDSGDVAGCTVVFSGVPADEGWGVPPAPGVGDGWDWSGYRYNGSPALVDWEAELIVSNTEPVAGFRAGTLETHKDARVLFEGFLNEITQRGYDVR